MRYFKVPAFLLFFKKPLGVALLSFIALFVGVNFFLTALIMLWRHNEITLSPMPKNPELVLATFEIGYLVVSLMLIYLAQALWKLKDWSRIVTSCLIALVLPEAFMQIVTDGFFWQIRWEYLFLHSAIFCSEIYFIYYLLREKTCLLFKPPIHSVSNDKNFITIKKTILSDDKN